MIDVSVQGEAIQAIALRRRSHGLQARFRFVDAPSDGVVPLRFTARAMRRPFRADRGIGVTVTTAHSDGIAHYLGMHPETYLLMCGLLGLTQWRALELNPLLCADDLGHRAPAACVFATHAEPEQYVLAFEHRHICPGCVDFFHWLGADIEVRTVRTALESDALVA